MSLASCILSICLLGLFTSRELEEIRMVKVSIGNSCPMCNLDWHDGELTDPSKSAPCKTSKWAVKLIFLKKGHYPWSRNYGVAEWTGYNHYLRLLAAIFQTQAGIFTLDSLSLYYRTKQLPAIKLKRIMKIKKKKKKP